MALLENAWRSDKEKCLDLLKFDGKGWNAAIFKESHLSKCAECRHVCRDPGMLKFASLIQFPSNKELYFLHSRIRM